MFFWRERIEPGRSTWGVDWGFTDRHGGRSRPPYAALNLGGLLGDDPDSVRANVGRVSVELGLEPDRLAFMRQVHGVALAEADLPDPQGPVRVSAPGPDPAPGGPEVAGCDAVRSRDPRVGVAVLVADCTPVLLLDPDGGQVAAVHAGRVGMADGVVEVAVDALRSAGATRLRAVVGPSICPRCYEVPADLRAEVSAVAPVAAAVSWAGTPALDIASAVLERLHARDVDTRWLSGCSREHPDLPSHRGGDPIGRFAGVARLLEPTGPAA